MLLKFGGVGKTFTKNMLWSCVKGYRIKVEKSEKKVRRWEVYVLLFKRVKFFYR